MATFSQELHLEVSSHITFARILAGLNLVLRYGITICIHATKKLMADFSLATVKVDRQTDNFSSYIEYIKQQNSCTIVHVHVHKKPSTDECSKLTLNPNPNPSPGLHL